MTRAESATQSADAISLHDLVREIFRSWRLVSAVALLVAAVCVSAGMFLPKQYEATVVLSSVNDQAGGGNLGGIAARVGGLSSLIGLGSANSGRKAEAVAMLQSDAMAVVYIKSENLLPLLFAEQWDAKSGDWRVADQSNHSLWLGGRRFQKISSVKEDTSTGLVEFSIRWTDPVLAARWANDLVALANKSLQQRAIDRSERNIAYLKEQAGSTSSVEVKAAIYSLLQEELKSAMLAKGDDEYALRVLYPAVPPERPSSVGMIVWIAVGLIGGSILGVMTAMIKIGFRR